MCIKKIKIVIEVTFQLHQMAELEAIVAVYRCQQQDLCRPPHHHLRNRQLYHRTDRASTTTTAAIP